MKQKSKLLRAARAAVHAANLLTEVSLAEMYRAQAVRTRNPKTLGVLRQIQAHEATHACEARARVPGPDGLRRAAETAARLSGRLVGTATALLGETPALVFDYVAERVGEIGYLAGLALVDEGAESERRVLERALGEEREHLNLIRDRLGI